MTNLNKILGIIGILIGILVNCCLLTGIIDIPFVAIIVLTIVGVIISFVSIKLGNKKKLIGIISAVLNLIALAFIGLLFITLG